MNGIRIMLFLAGLLGLAALQLPLYECISADGIHLSVSQFDGLKKQVLVSENPVVCPKLVPVKTKSLEALFMTSSILPGILLLLALNSISRASPRSYRAMMALGCLQCLVALCAIYLMRDQIDGVGLGSYSAGLGGLLAIIGSMLAFAQIKTA
ncbi:MAG: hypothetical protein VYA30_11810 [Myxococcota bacterium]|nr:hypothetical protein [Myxococcota bacterium]